MARRTRLDRVQRGVHLVMSRLVAAGVVDVAGWDKGSRPYQQSTEEPPKSLITYALTSGPSAGVREGAHFDKLLKPPDSVVVRFTAATEGARPWIKLNGFEHFFDVPTGGTEASRQLLIRDAFIASINLEHADECVASINDPNEMLLTANFLGGLWSLEPKGEILVGDGVFSDNAVAVTTGREDSLLTINAYSKSHELRNGAVALIDEVVGELRLHEVIQILSRYGMAVGSRGPVVPLHAIAGASWETRAAIDIGLHTSSYIIEPKDLVETVRLTLDIFTPGASTPFTQTVLAQAP